MGSLIPLFSTSGDVFSGFKPKVGSLIRAWWRHMYTSKRALVGQETRIYYTTAYNVTCHNVNPYCKRMIRTRIKRLLSNVFRTTHRICLDAVWSPRPSFNETSSHPVSDFTETGLWKITLNPPGCIPLSHASVTRLSRLDCALFTYVLRWCMQTK